jgi:glycosyltransferase involved in cell wall biosynthesis
MNEARDRKKVRLMFIIDFIYTSVGGTETQLLRLIKHLDRQRFEIHLVSLRATEWLTQNRQRLDCHLKTYDVIKLKNPANLIRFLSLARYIKDTDPDIVITFFPLSNIVAVLAARLGKATIILSTRRDYGLWLNKWSLPLLRFANRYVSGIVANSEIVKSLTGDAESFDASKIHVIYNGLDVLDIRPFKRSARRVLDDLGIPPENKVVGILANLRPMKHHKTLIKAAQRILKVRQDIDFVIVGEGPLRRELEDFTASMKVDAHFHFVGRQEDVLPFLSIFHVGVNCSANEGLSNAIMEYMAYGVPCIVSRAGGNPELVEHGVNGHTFELDDDDTLAQLILRLLDDPENQHRFAERSREIILSRMTTERMIGQYEQYFLQLLSRNSNEGGKGEGIHTRIGRGNL